MRETVTIYVPEGYANAAEFLKDCGFELVKPPKTPWDAHHNRTYWPVERRAAEIYEAFSFNSLGSKPPWVHGGNSLMQDEARICARKELRDAGHVPADQ